ncbi:MAG: ATP-binding protein [Bacteroidota bacterium]
MRYLFSSFLAILIGLPGHAQELPFTVRNFGIEEGLSNEWVSAIAQDEKGYLWIGTQYGLNRFDGHEFEVFTYRPKDGLSGNWIRDIAATDHRLFLAPLGQGLQEVRESGGLFLPAWRQKGWGSASIRSMAKCTEDEYLVSTSEGVFKWASTATRSSPPELIDSGSFHDIEVLDRHWAAAGSSGLVLGSGDSFELVHAHTTVRATEFISPDSLLSQSMREIYLSYKLADKTWATERLTDKLLTGIPINGIEPFIYRDRQGQIWMPTTSGLICLDVKLDIVRRISTNELFAAAGLRGNGQLLSFFQDREGTYWAGTDRGIFQLVPQVSFRQSILENIESPLSRTREVVKLGDTLWLARPGGLYRYIDKIDAEPQLFLTGRFQSLEPDFQGNIYAFDMGTSPDRLLRIRYDGNRVGEVVKSCPSQEGSENWDMALDHQRRVWVARQNDLLCYDPKRDTCFVINLIKDGRILAPFILELLVDNQNRMWIGTVYSGLLLIEDIAQLQGDATIDPRQYLYDPDDPYSLSTSLIQQLHQTRSGTIWVGTDGGLNRLREDEKGFDRFLRSDRMPDDKILGISSDDRGKIWFSTISHGIISYDPVSDNYRTVGSTDGLLGDAMFLSSVWRDEEGFLFFGGQAGLQAFHPDSIDAGSIYQPELIWELEEWQRSDTVVTNYQPAFEAGSLLTAKDNSWRVKFSVPTFMHPENWRYRFKLEGYHTDWLPWQKSGELRLSQLPKGRYRLLVEAADQNTGIRLNYADISLRVWPPWYFSNLAYLVYLFLGIGIVYQLYRLQIRRKLAEAERAQTILASEERLQLFNRVAHEFRTPLTIIQGAIDRIKHDDKGDEKVRLNQIEQQSKHLDLQVSQILNLAALKSGQQAVQLERGDLIAYLRQLFTSFRSAADQRQIQLVFRSEQASLPTVYNADHWRKVINNLLGNALKYCPPGSTVEMKIKAVEASKLSIIIKDNGPGIAQDFQSKIFEPFTRERADHKTGSGIGLALVKELVEDMNGHIELVSTLGQGATFTIEVPVEIETTADKDLPGIGEDRPLIFIAEDQPEIVEYLQFCLQNSYQVLSAGDGQTAWDKCREHPPDLLISDIVMPGLDGLELCQRMKTHAATDHVPVILLTAKASPTARHAGLSRGADAYLPKPFDRTELNIRVEQLIAQRDRLRAKYRQQGDSDTNHTDTPINPFVKEITQMIRERLSDPTFDVQAMATACHLSRTQLFRKLKHLTGVSPSDMIINARLARARELLALGQTRVNEVAYACGFQDPAYFSRLFKKKMGQTPSEAKTGMRPPAASKNWDADERGMNTDFK